MRRTAWILAVASVAVITTACGLPPTGTSSGPAAFTSSNSAAVRSPIAAAGRVAASSILATSSPSAAPSPMSVATNTGSLHRPVTAMSTAGPLQPRTATPTNWPTAVPPTTSGTKTFAAPEQVNLAETRFLALAQTAFPDVPTAPVIGTGKMLCTNLGQGASLHDEVGQLASRTQAQAIAEKLLRAAVAAYCPTVTLH